MTVANFFSYTVRWGSVLSSGLPGCEPTDEMLSDLPGPVDSNGEASYVEPWRTMDADMLEFSKLFPGKVFAVYVRDWIDCEYFVAYYCRGMKQEKWAQIVYPEPDKEFGLSLTANRKRR